MVDLKKIKEKYNELHDSYISEFIVKNEEKLKIEVTFKCYDDYKVKMIFEDIENFKYGVDGDYIIYNTLFICENGIYTFATKENFEESEELDYFYVKCKKIEIEEK